MHTHAHTCTHMHTHARTCTHMQPRYRDSKFLSVDPAPPAATDMTVEELRAVLLDASKPLFERYRCGTCVLRVLQACISLALSLISNLCFLV